MQIDGTHFCNNWGEPLFWLADTAWNAPLSGNEAEWREYLGVRAQQGFTVIQFVATQWRGRHEPFYGPLYTVMDNSIQFNEMAFSAMDRWIELVNAEGLVAAPVMLWANTPTCPGQALTEPHAIALGRHMLQRWAHYDIVWLLAGDGRYTDAQTAERWRRIGRGIFGDAPEAVVTMHPCGVSWVGDLFANEPWYSFVGIQSGHGRRPNEIQFLVNGDYAHAWHTIAKPFLNLEPNYEFSIAYGTTHMNTAYEVRRASYWSLLSAPIAGVSYGNNAIWPWGHAYGEVAEGHDSNWQTRPWREGLETDGTNSLQVLRTFFDGLPWTALRPTPSLLALQPGQANEPEWVTISATPQLDCIVAYLSRGGTISLTSSNLPQELEIWWVDPRTGEWYACPQPAGTSQLDLSAPDQEDWLLVLQSS